MKREPKPARLVSMNVVATDMINEDGDMFPFGQGKGDQDDDTVGGIGSGLSVRSKLLLMLLASSLISIAVIGYMGNRSGVAALTKTFSERLLSIRNAKKAQVESYIKSERDAFGIFGTDVSVIAAINSFKQGVQQLGSQPINPNHEAKLRVHYRDNFLPLAAKNERKELDFEAFFPRNPTTKKMQALYIAANPYKPGEKDKLGAVPESALPVQLNYTLNHSVYHPWFRDLQQRLNLYDVFLIDDTGRIIYSVFKETDFGTNLNTGPYRDSSLARLYREVMKTKKKGEVKISDFEFYAPSFYQAAAFIAVPVYSNWKFVGVIAAQLSIEKLNSVMSNNFDWKSEGLGKTGEAYIVGSDFKMRTDSRRRREDQDGYINTLKSQQVVDGTIKDIINRKSAILLQRINADHVKLALDGKSGTRAVEGYQGTRVLSSYTPLNIAGLDWALVTEISENEALHDQRALARRMLIAACLLSILTTLAALFLASRFLAPVNELVSGIDSLKDGNQDTRIRKLSNDEFGELTDAFNDMATEIEDRNAVIQNKSTAYESLLRSIFPDAVAERLKSGEGQIIETVDDATVVYLTLHGFTSATEEMDGADAIKLLNEIVDAIDVEAEKQGVEKVKTMGEHYLAVCGLSTPRLDHMERTLNFAELVYDELDLINKQQGLSLSMRAGIASGRVRAGLVGQKRFVYDVWGRPANLARRIVYAAGLNSLRITEAIYEQLHKPKVFVNSQTIETQTLGDVVTYEMALGTEDRLEIATNIAQSSKANGNQGVSNSGTDKNGADDKGDAGDADKAEAASSKTEPGDDETGSAKGA